MSDKNKKWNVAVVGALGMVGTEMIKTLESRNFPVSILYPLDVSENEGKEVVFKGFKVTVKEAKRENFSGVDIAIFSAGAGASMKLAPLAVEQGVVLLITVQPGGWILIVHWLYLKLIQRTWRSTKALSVILTAQQYR